MREGIIHHLIRQSLCGEEDEAEEDEEVLEETNKIVTENGDKIMEDMESERLELYPFLRIS